MYLLYSVMTECFPIPLYLVSWTNFSNVYPTALLISDLATIMIMSKVRSQEKNPRDGGSIYEKYRSKTPLRLYNSNENNLIPSLKINWMEGLVPTIMITSVPN